MESKSWGGGFLTLLSGLFSNWNIYVGGENVFIQQEGDFDLQEL